MADVTQSLFGITPESLMAAREQQLQDRAYKFAQLDPMQQAQAGFYMAGNRLGSGLGGLLGAEDPELMRVRQRQQLLQGLDPNDAKALRAKATELLKTGDYPAASQLSQRALDIETKQANIAKDMATANRERQQAIPADIQKAQRIAALNMAIPAYEAAGEKETARLLKDERDALLPADKTVSYGAEAERVSQELYKKPFSQLTQPEMAAVNKRVDESKERNAPKIIMPGQTVPQKDWLQFVDYLDKNPLFKQSSSIISAAPSALETIRMSTTNDIAAKAVEPQLARMAGETGALSANDVNRWAKAGGLDDRLIGSAVSFFTGRLTTAKKEQAEKYVSAVFRGALLEQKRLLENNATEFGYDASPNYKARLKNINAQLERFKKPSDNKPVESVVKVQPTGNPLIDKYLITP